MQSTVLGDKDGSESLQFGNFTSLVDGLGKSISGIDNLVNTKIRDALVDIVDPLTNPEALKYAEKETRKVFSYTKIGAGFAILLLIVMIMLMVWAVNEKNPETFKNLIYANAVVSGFLIASMIYLYFAANILEWELVNAPDAWIPHKLGRLNRAISAF